VEPRHHHDGRELAQALATGNTCVLKPPSVNSLLGLKLAEVMEQAELPPEY